MNKKVEETNCHESYTFWVPCSLGALSTDLRHVNSDLLDLGLKNMSRSCATGPPPYAQKLIALGGSLCGRKSCRIGMTSINALQGGSGPRTRRLLSHCLGD